MSRRRLRAAVVLFIFVASGVARAAPPSTAPPHRTLQPSLRQAIARATPGTFLSVIVTLRDRADLTGLPRAPAVRLSRVIARLDATSDQSQAAIRSQLRTWRDTGSVGDFRPFWIFDGIALEATPEVVEAIAARPDVLRVDLDRTVAAPAAALGSAAPPESNVALVNAPQLWNMGFDGQGVVVGSLDTGVDASHPDLSASWRGGSNSWFDPNGQHPTVPTDVNGHGTSAMGVMVGGSAGGTAIGVAPGAQWIAAKIFDDSGSATTSGIHAAFEWILDPDGNPATADAPDIVNNSWTIGSPGCDLTFQADLQALRAAGILPVFAAGNGGPAPGTSYSPSNNPEAFAVGATDNADAIASLSSRGPTACGGSTGVFPELTAPGVGIHTTERFGFYTDVTGTSVAAPHVAGALALLLQAFPGTTPAIQARALEEGAIDLGSAGPDDTYGSGRLDALASYEWLGDQPPPPPPSLLRLSISAGGNRQIGSLDVRDEDVLSFDGASFSLLFDGSDVGVGRVDVDAFSMLDADSLLLSFDARVTITGLGVVDDSDVVRFDATSLGSTTSGTFQMYLDGSDVALVAMTEDVDEIELLPDGRILLSTGGKVKVRGVTGRDEDLLAFAPTSLGDVTAGSFTLYFDGSDVDLATTRSEDLDGAAVDVNGKVLLSTVGAFSVTGIAGDGDDVFVCTPSSLGAATACDYAPTPFFDASSWGAAGLGLDALELS